MVAPRTWLSALRRRRTQLRTSERGTAIFIVILVITVLTGIGVFAARAAGLNQRSSGYDRQATQTGYVADFGTTAGLDELSAGTSQAYLQQMMSPGSEVCTVNSGLSGNPPCYRMFLQDVAARVSTVSGSAPVFDMDGGGAFGPSIPPLQPDFVVEMTDPAPAGRPVAGMDQGGTGPRFRYYQVTLSGIGQVRPAVTGAGGSTGSCTTTETTAAAQAAGTRTTRAIVEVGPVPE